MEFIASLSKKEFKSITFWVKIYKKWAGREDSEFI